MLIQRGQTYHLDTTIAGKRYRFSLGTCDERSATRIENRVHFAIADGPNSLVWPQLSKTLPKSSYKTLTSSLNIPEETDLTAFQKTWEEHLDRRVKLGELAESSAKLYRGTSAMFFAWLAGREIQLMDKISPSIVEKYTVHRKECLEAKGRGGRGITTEQTVLNAVFDLALREGVIKSNPVKYRFRPDADPEGAEPFTPEEMSAMEIALDSSNRLAFMILKHTGLRGSDVCNLTWSSINWTDKTLVWKTKKRGTHVTIPIANELFLHLWSAYEDQVLDHKILWLSRRKLYSLVQKLGEKSGVKNCHPHRFRDSFCVTLLKRGASIFDVAKLIGDTVATVEKHYASVTPQIVERARVFMEEK